MKIYELSNSSEALALSQKLLLGEEGLIVYSGEKGLAILTGEFATYDTVFCQKYHLQVVKSIYHGGTIVSFPGDLDLAYIHWGPSDFGKKVIDFLAEWLRKKGLSVRQDNNDILVDDKKVASYAIAMNDNGWYEDVVHISIFSDELVISKICTKRMVKKPGSLSDYGLKKEDIWNALIETRLIQPE